jgi:hypothetical protein
VEGCGGWFVYRPRTSDYWCALHAAIILVCRTDVSTGRRGVGEV